MDNYEERREERIERREERWHRRPHSIFWPLLLIGVGVYLLLDTLNLVPGNAWDTLWRLWPLLFIAGGLDSLYRGEGYVGALVGIGLGGVFLLSNFGYLQISGWTLILRLWPVFLIAWGLDLVIGQRGVVSAVVGVLVGLLLIAGIYLFTTNYLVRPGVVQTQDFAQELDGADEADVRLEVIAADLAVRGGAESGDLVTGAAGVSGREQVKTNYSVSDGRGHFRLDQEGMNFVFPFSAAPVASTWEILLADVPVALDSSLVFGQQTVDLTGLEVEDVQAETVFGRTVITLPEEGLDGGRATVVFGEVVVRVPAGVDVVINADTGIAGTSLPDGFERSGNRITSPEAGSDSPVDIQVNVPIGSLRVEVVR